MNKKTVFYSLGGLFVLSQFFKKNSVKINVNSSNLNNNQPAAVAAAAVQAGVQKVDKTKPRGIRNNNPGNIKHSADRWQGMAQHQADPVFVTFTQPHYGLRALAKLLKNYKKKYGIDNVAALIKRYSATDQRAYIENMARGLGVTALQKIDIEAYLSKIMTAIIKQENGYNPYSPNEISAAIAAA